MREYLPNNDWNLFFEELIEKDFFSELMENIEKEYSENQCFPKKEDVFNAFHLCQLNSLKVVILGQDPYHDIGQANGLAFSVNDGIKFPPSLKNIFKEMENDLDIAIPISGNLEYLAKQGVLLLNTVLTVRAHKANSHKGIGWQKLTDMVIKYISENKEDVVFLLWGGNAKKKLSLINKEKHHILESGHPSPLSANRGFWFGNSCFSETNKFLKQKNIPKIKWVI